MWNQSLIDGPLQIPIHGEPIEIEGALVTPVIGYHEGYHLNVATQLVTPEVEPYIITPATPQVVFFGAETIFLKFPDEATAKTVLAPYWSDPVAPE